MSKEIHAKQSIEREESPAELLEVFQIVSSMTLDGNGNKNTPPVDFTKGKVLGAVIVGSCTNPESHPKDLDIILFVKERAYPPVERYATDLSESFDSELAFRRRKFYMGKLDICAVVGCITNPTYFEREFVIPAIKSIQNPKVFSFDENSSLEIKKRIDELKNL